MQFINDHRRWWELKLWNRDSLARYLGKPYYQSACQSVILSADAVSLKSYFSDTAFY
jgi:hypothetical protein